MDVEVSDHSVALRMTRAEAQSLCVAVAEGYEGLSRQEYFIRTGLSQPAVVEFVQRLFSVLDGPHGEVSLPLEAGVEEVENPRRPRPAR
jgi:hypothetical protein